MLRTLKPVEIAEGALLADVAVIYQLLVNYVPFVGDLFRFPIFIIFAILVLRRGLYVSVMSSCVALFLIGILTGPSHVSMFSVEILGGLYLGVMMRSRRHPAAVILLGATCGALTLYLLAGIASLLTGVPISSFVQFLHRFFAGLVQFVNLFALRLGDLLHVDSEGFWLHQMLPPLKFLGDLAFTYWWLTGYVLFWGFSFISTFLVYTACNLFVRLLGYEVRAFPSERFIRRVRHARRRVVRRVQRYLVVRRSHAKL